MNVQNRKMKSISKNASNDFERMSSPGRLWFHFGCQGDVFSSQNVLGTSARNTKSFFI